MPQYQIGTSEPRGVVGSRASRSENLSQALEECREYSRYRHVKEAWLRTFENGTLGDVIATFRKGVRV